MNCDTSIPSPQVVVERRLKFRVPNPSSCIKSTEELLSYMRDQASVDLDIPLFNSGVKTPPVDQRSLPWQRYNNSGNLLGVFYWSNRLSAWIIPGVPGELKTVLRTASDIETDRREKGLLDGWALADGTDEDYPSVPDLSGVEAYFVENETEVGLVEVRGRLDDLEGSLDENKLAVETLRSDFSQHVEDNSAHSGVTSTNPDDHTTQAEMEAYVATQLAENSEEVLKEAKDYTDERVEPNTNWAVYTLVSV